ncbi:MAG: glycosyltransferase family 2 protein [Elusimicrobiota bacterium]|jgi:hypothetical protein
MAPVTCSIIVPSFNTCELTLSCLRSVQKHPPATPYEIILVDNNSNDETYARVRREFPEVQAVCNASNLGFGKACNIGSRLAKGRYLLFLNSDTESLPDTFNPLIDWLDTHPHTAIVGPELLSSQHGLIQMSWAWNPILLGEFIQRPLAPYLVRHSQLRQAIVRWLQRRARSVPIICGACFMVRRRAFDEIAGFDEEFELYFEDSDLCLRCRQKGWSIDYIPHAQIIHHLGQSTKEPWSLTSLVYRQSQIYYYRKHAFTGAVPILKSYLLLKWFKLWWRVHLIVQDKEAGRAYLSRFRKTIFERQRFRLADPKT